MAGQARPRKPERGGRTLGKLKHFDENSEEKFFKALPSPFGAVIAVGVAIGLINLIAMMLDRKSTRLNSSHSSVSRMPSSA